MGMQVLESAIPSLTHIARQERRALLDTSRERDLLFPKHEIREFAASIFANQRCICESYDEFSAYR